MNVIFLAVQGAGKGTFAKMLQDKYENLENLYRTAQNDLSNAAQSQYILNALGRFVAYPPVAATIATQG